MYRDHTIAVVVPAYDEESLIGLGMSSIPVIETMPEYVDRVVVEEWGRQESIGGMTPV